MIIRVFTARPKPGKTQELLQLATEISIPFVDRQPGLIARYTGTGMGATGEELVFISVWRDLDGLKNMTGDDWESEVIPDQRIGELIESSSVRNYVSIG